MTEDRDEIKRWLDEVLAVTGGTPTGHGRRAGLSPSTLTRFLQDPENAALIKAATLAKISHATGVALPARAGAPIQVDAAVAQRAAHSFGESEAVPYRLHGTDVGPFEKAVEDLCGARLSADPWQLKSRALELAGYVPGDILIVDLAEPPLKGDVVCAQVYRWREGKADTVFRFFEPPYLVAASTDRAFRRPLWLDNERVVIKGVVTASLRPRQGRPA